MAKIDKAEARGPNQTVISHVFGAPDGYADNNVDGYGGKVAISTSAAADITILPNRQYRLCANVECYFNFHDGTEPVLSDEYGAMLPEYVPEVFRSLETHNTLSVLGSATGSIWVNEMRDR